MTCNWVVPTIFQNTYTKLGKYNNVMILDYFYKQRGLKSKGRWRGLGHIQLENFEGTYHITSYADEVTR